MRITIKLQSVSDIITNSSSECYTIKSRIEETQLREILDKQLAEWGYEREENGGFSGVYDYWIHREGKYILVNWSVMCNVSENLVDFFRSIFGKDSVWVEY